MTEIYLKSQTNQPQFHSNNEQRVILLGRGIYNDIETYLYRVESIYFSENEIINKFILDGVEIINIIQAQIIGEVLNPDKTQILSGIEYNYTFDLLTIDEAKEYKLNLGKKWLEENIYQGFYYSDDDFDNEHFGLSPFDQIVWLDLKNDIRSGAETFVTPCQEVKNWDGEYVDIVSAEQGLAICDKAKEKIIYWRRQFAIIKDRLMSFDSMEDIGNIVWEVS